MSNLVNEILLRLAKAGIAALVARLCWLSAAAFILLVETGLI